MVPQRAWVYMVERCSPSEMSLAALTVIYHGAFDVWLMKTIQYDVKELRFGMMLTQLTLNCLSKVILMLGMQLCSIMAAMAYTPTASEAANRISFMLVSRIPWKRWFWALFVWNHFHLNLLDCFVREVNFWAKSFKHLIWNILVLFSIIIVDGPYSSLVSTHPPWCQEFSS